MGQLSFFEPINDKELRNILIKELKHYKALKVKLENQKENKDGGIVDLFPTLRNTDKISEYKVKQIERALYSLDALERKIIELKYLTTEEVNDIEIYLTLGIKKGKYYLKKRTALYNLATALGII
ncbi:ArpU family transcriptional regulator [Niallia circulans]|uniref:ArpU family transcriptional regulator n=1 Tax=Niallia circulans TaxID=1397 RepID=A0A0J1IMV4_NIACI|nr:ArpU family phage packaging/lysis transcriptional regulator [Niallia circulans]KLV27243.1 ArpU family transcriptional regulator [Niallia circulans]